MLPTLQNRGADYSYTGPGYKYFQLFRAHGLCLNILTQPCTTKATKRRLARQEWLCTSATWAGRTCSLGSVPGSTPPTPALELSGFQTLATSNLCKKPTQFEFKPSLGSEATARVHTPALPGAACPHPHPRPDALLAPQPISQGSWHSMPGGCVTAMLLPPIHACLLRAQLDPAKSWLGPLRKAA